jgi:hypothetical protein
VARAPNPSAPALLHTEIVPATRPAIERAAVPEN